MQYKKPKKDTTFFVKTLPNIKQITSNQLIKISYKLIHKILNIIKLNLF
jgi:hypothetical protein